MIDDMPEIPLSRRQALVTAVALLAVLAVAGRFLLAGGQSRAPAVSFPRPALRAAPVRAPQLVVDVTGAVRRPGVYSLPAGSRVQAALARAGGPTRAAELTLVNLAAPLADGQQVLVPLRSAAGPTAAPVAVAAGPVHLNVATVEQLDALPGVGPATAQRIVDYRTAHGPFRSVDELDAVPGIGPAKLDELRKLVAP